MTPAELAGDLVVLGAVVAPLVAAARAARQRLLPAWSGPPAVLADALLVLAILTAITQALGTAGLFSRFPLIAACVVVGGSALALAGRLPLGPGSIARIASLTPPSRVAVAVTGLAVAIVGAQWLAFTFGALHEGMTHTDSLWYHLPFAARFAEDGFITALHHTVTEPLLAATPQEAQHESFSIGTPTFYPANTSLLHAVGIVATGYDWPSPLLNLAWMALALLGAWCAGGAYGVAPHATVATALLLASPMMVTSQPGEALNDVAVLALVLGAAGVLLNAVDSRAALAIAGAGAGLALGTKLSAFAPALGLGIVAMAASGRGSRLRAFGAFAGAAVVTGSFWYLRNVVHTGSPVPYVDSLGPIHLPSPDLPLTDQYSYAIAHYATRFDVWADWFEPGLRGGLGRAWPAVVLLAVTGGVAAVARGRSAAVRALGVVFGLSLGAFFLTPLTAGGTDGEPFLFLYTLRYVTPVLVLGLLLLAIVVPERGRGVLLASYVAALLVTISASWLPFWRSQAIGVTCAVAVLSAAWVLGRGRYRGARYALSVAVVALGFVLGVRQVDNYLDSRYANPHAILGQPFSWARDVSGARIATVGFFEQYPLYGLDLSNRVEYVGRRGAHGAYHPVASCQEWRQAVDSGGYEYVMIAPNEAQHEDRVRRGDVPEPQPARWTSSSPNARPILRAPGNVSVFRLTGELGPSGC